MYTSASEDPIYISTSVDLEYKHTPVDPTYISTPVPHQTRGASLPHPFTPVGTVYAALATGQLANYAAVQQFVHTCNYYQIDHHDVNKGLNILASHNNYSPPPVSPTRPYSPTTYKPPPSPPSSPPSLNNDNEEPDENFEWLRATPPNTPPSSPPPSPPSSPNNDNEEPDENFEWLHESPPGRQTPTPPSSDDEPIFRNYHDGIPRWRKHDRVYHHERNTEDVFVWVGPYEITDISGQEDHQYTVKRLGDYVENDFLYRAGRRYEFYGGSLRSEPDRDEIELRHARLRQRIANTKASLADPYDTLLDPPGFSWLLGPNRERPLRSFKAVSRAPR